MLSTNICGRSLRRVSIYTPFCLGGDHDEDDDDVDDVINRGERIVFSGLNMNKIWILIFVEHKYMWPIIDSS